LSLLTRLRSKDGVALPGGSVIGHTWSSFLPQMGTAIGIDIGAGALKVAQMKWHRGGPQLENFAVIPLEGAYSEEGAVIDPVGLGDLLQAGLQAMGLSVKQVGTNVGGPSLRYQHVNLQKVPLAELRQAMRFEAPQQFSAIPEEQLLWDFTPVPEAIGVPEYQQAIFLAGTHRRLVDSFLATLGRAGLKVDAVELDCLVQLRALQWAGLVPHASAGPLVLFDVGERSAKLSILRHGVPMFSRTMPTGLTHLRGMVADSLGLSHEEAEMALRAPSDTVRAATEPHIVELVDAVARSVEYYLYQNRGVTIERFFLVGGGAGLPHLLDSLTSGLAAALPASENLSLRIQTGSLGEMEVASRLQPTAGSNGHLLLGAIGSALRGEDA
jgi:type IV pilus assembly protein PilM